MSQLQQQLHQPEVHGEHKAAWVTISTDEYESMKATIEVLSNSKLMKQIMESEEDIKMGRTKSLDELIKGLKKKS